MRERKTILWYGDPPLEGIRLKLDSRGFRLVEKPTAGDLTDYQLADTAVVILSHTQDTVEQELEGYRNIPRFIDHGILVLIVVPTIADFQRIRDAHLYKISRDFPWNIKDDKDNKENRPVLFLTDLMRTNFDTIVAAAPAPKWHSFSLIEIGKFRPLTDEEKLLVKRAFGKAEEVHIKELKSGFTPSRVFIAYEKRNQVLSSIAHWTQPRLLKIGARADLKDEIRNMELVAPFVPFELRPNLEIYLEGFRRSVLITDFVDNSESLNDAARAGRAETAISNLFNRTLHRWRERAWSCGMSGESLATAAERLGMFKAEDVREEYLECVTSEGIDVAALWDTLKLISFAHRAATIHADLHGDNVRVRGTDAILIDLGSVKGSDKIGEGAPLSFDVAMLEVALVFTCSDEELKGPFQQDAWEGEIRKYYKLGAVLSTPARESAPAPDSWIFGCIHRLRAFGIYDQSGDRHEYAIALAIAMLRWCKFKPSEEADRGRRVVALRIASELIGEIKARRSSPS